MTQLSPFYAPLSLKAKSLPLKSQVRQNTNPKIHKNALNTSIPLIGDFQQPIRISQAIGFKEQH